MTTNFGSSLAAFNHRNNSVGSLEIKTNKKVNDKKKSFSLSAYEIMAPYHNANYCFIATGIGDKITLVSLHFPTLYNHGLIAIVETQLEKIGAINKAAIIYKD